MQNNWNAFSEYVENLMKEEHIAGAAVAVSKNGKLLFQQGFGYRNVKQNLPVTPETIMGIASVSKSFTALQIMRLAAAGILNTDDLVIRHLPSVKLPGMDMNKIRIHHLLSHTTGLPPIKRRQDHLFYDTHIEYLNNYDTTPLGEPGDYFSYANDTFLLLGAIIEKYSGMRYNRYMTQLLDELQMYRSTYYIEELAKFENVTENYIYNQETAAWETRHWPVLGVFEVGGGVRSCVTDLLHYGELYINGGMYNGCQLISTEYLNQMWQQVYEVGKNQYYGYALKSTPNYAGVTLVEHGGSQPGVASNFGFVPEEKIVAAVLTNVSGAPANSIWNAAINTALGLPIEYHIKQQHSQALSDEQITRITGLYTSDEGAKLLIYREGEVLRAISGDEYLTLKALSPDTLIINEKKIKNVIRLYFQDNERPAWAAFVGSRMLRRKI